MPEDNGTGRLDRIERILDAIAVKLAATNNDFDRMREEHDRDYKQLMTAQVLMQDNLRILTENMQEHLRIQTENQKHFDQRVDKLVSAIGEFIRSRPNPSSAA
jgi:hypothetical protein